MDSVWQESERRDGDESLNRVQGKQFTDRIEALISIISQYHDVYPIVQRGVQFLCRDLSDENCGNTYEEEAVRVIQRLAEAGTLEGILSAMTSNLDSPAFIRSCFELLAALVNKPNELIVTALWKSDYLAVLNKIVHNVVYLNESTCVQLGMSILSKLVKSLDSIENEFWAQLIAIAAQAMFTNTLNEELQVECMLNLKLLFQLKSDTAVPAASANIILKTVDQYNRHTTDISKSYASLSVVVVCRIFEKSSQKSRGCTTPILAAVLHHYQLSMGLNESHRIYVEKHIHQSLHAAFTDSLARLAEHAELSTASNSGICSNELQNATMKLLLCVLWREEARAFLDSGGMTVLLNIYESEVETHATLKNGLARTLYYVSVHWPDEMWNVIQIRGPGLVKWLNVITEWCENENEDDGVLRYLLAMIKAMLNSEGFLKEFTASKGVEVIKLALHKHRQLPLCARLSANILLSVPGLYLASFSRELCCSLAEAMISFESNCVVLLEYVIALTFISRQSEGRIAMSAYHAREIIRVLRSNLTDVPLTAKMLSFVASALLDPSTRAAFIDGGLLQVVAKAICTHQWDHSESVGMNARQIICDTAQKFDVSRNLSTLEPLAHVFSGHSSSSPAISLETIDLSCAMIGALACVKSLHPLLIQDGAIKCVVGILRFCKQEVATRSEDSFFQLVNTCFYALSSLVNVPVVVDAMDSALDGQLVYSQLADSGAEDTIIGCLEEAVRVENASLVLVNSGCRLLRTVLTFPIITRCETESRWIAVANSILQRHLTQPKTRELLFATTLVVLSRAKHAVEGARGQHVKMMKLILGIIVTSIQHKKICVLLQAECTGAVRVLEELGKRSDSIADILVSKCLGTLGELMGIFILSPSASAQDCLRVFESAIRFFATTGYVNRLMDRLDMWMAREEFMEPSGMMDMFEDLKALKALLFSDQATRTNDTYHNVFKYIAAIVENGITYSPVLRDNAHFFLELGCLSSQLHSSAHQGEMVNTALCHFAEDTTWHSMRWIAALAHRNSSEFMLVSEFVLLRIISGYSILEPALLTELLDALNYLLRCSKSKEVVLVSPHVRDLQSVVWELIYAAVAHLDSGSKNYGIAVSLLGIISSLLSSLSGELFSIRSKQNGGDLLVRFCLGALDIFFLDSSVGLTKCALMEEVLQATSAILQSCIQLGSEYAGSIVQHQATQRAFCMPVGTKTIENIACVNWCVVVLGACIQSHGLLYAEQLLNLSPNPTRLLVRLVSAIAQNTESFPWDSVAACISMENGSPETMGWQEPCSALFEQVFHRTKCLVHEQATVTRSATVNVHISDTIALLSFKYGQLCLDTSRNEEACLDAIIRSGLSFLDLFRAASSFGVLEYSAIVSLHLKIARLVGFSTQIERSNIEETATRIRQLLSPVSVSDEVLADYLDLVTTMYLSTSIQAAPWIFIEAAGQVWSISMERLTTGLVRSQTLEKSLLKCVSSLRNEYAARWESGEIESALKLVKIFSPDKWSQQLLMQSVLMLPQGLLHLFELARAAKSSETHLMIMYFLFQHVDEIQLKTQRIGELEINMILSLIRRNVAGRVGDTCQRKWGQVTGSEFLRSALETLELFVRRKSYAILCSDLRGVATLYDVLCAPSQYQGTVKVALEICCCLAGHGANLTQENSPFVLQLLLISVDYHVDSYRSRFAFLVLEYFLAHGISDLTLPMIQQCRTQIVPQSARSNEEGVFIQQLYIIRQKIARISRPPASNGAPASQKSLNDGEICEIIISNCRRFVQYPNGKDGFEYIDLKSSEKSLIEPLEYYRLREAIDQLSFILDDLDMVMNYSFVSPLVPALCETLALHTNTTATMCTVMQILDQISFVNPSIVVFNKHVKVPALFASFSLHQRSSLEFARYLSRFCNSITADLRENDEELAISLLPLLLELLQHWKLDFEIVDQNLATLSNFLDIMRIEKFDSGDILVLTNAVVIPYISNTLSSWHWIKCTFTIVNKLDKLGIESVQDTVATVIRIIHMFMSHNFMVEKAVLVLILVYVETHQLPFRHLIESDAVEMLLTCLKLNVNNGSIARSCLRLLVGLTSVSDTATQGVSHLLTSATASSIILVARKNFDNSLICGMCIELIHRMVESFSKYSEKSHKVSVPGDLSRKKSELLTSLLEADIISLIFDLLDNYSSRGHDHLLETLLLLLKSLTKDESLRESAEVLHGLHELKQTIDRARKYQLDGALVELAIDCLVNLACSDRMGHEWREISLWLLELAESIHNLKSDSTGMCVEKLIGVLGRLSVDNAICKTILPKGSFTILELLATVGSDYPLEQALYGLLCSLCDDIECAQVLIVVGAIKTTAERISCHIYDEETLLCSLCFLDLLVLNCGESYAVLLDGVVFQALDLVIYTYPETSGSPLHHLSSTIREKVSALDYQSTRTKPVTPTSAKIPAPQGQNPDFDRPFRDLLRAGGTFRVLWEARPGAVEKIQIKLAPSGDYLLFRRQTPTQLPRIERIFVSQLEVCPQRSLNAESPPSPSKKILSQSISKENFEGDHVLRLKVRGEDVLIKTNSTRERVHWDQALQWLVSHRESHK